MNKTSGATTVALDTTSPFGTVVSTGTVTSSSIAVSWTPATDNQSAQSALVYKVYAQTSDFSSISGLVEVGTTSAGATTYSLTGLSPSATYFIAVIAVDESSNEETLTSSNKISVATSSLDGVSVIIDGVTSKYPLTSWSGNGSGSFSVSVASGQLTMSAGSSYGTISKKITSTLTNRPRTISVGISNFTFSGSGHSEIRIKLYNGTTFVAQYYQHLGADNGPYHPNEQTSQDTYRINTNPTGSYNVDFDFDSEIPSGVTTADIDNVDGIEISIQADTWVSGSSVSFQAGPMTITTGTPGTQVFQPDANTIGLWHFDEGSGSTTADASSNGFNGTLSGGASWTSAGYSGNAISFQANRQYVQLPDSPIWDSLTQFTIEARIYPINIDTTSTMGITILGRHNSFGSDNWEMGLLQQTNVNGPSGAVYVSLTGQGQQGVPMYSTTTLAINNWYHVALTWDGSTVKLFIDGNLEASASTPFSTLDDLSHGPRIGWYNSNFDNSFKGIIDEVRISNIVRY
ncbi:MAG: fibronectin type III domain-containing protein [Planctomycetes bacterium]|nr:fibronectin type III domain-containing protein [Planctomycetota bacterium]